MTPGTDDLVDERYNCNLGCYAQQQKKPIIESLFQNLNISTTTTKDNNDCNSPPLTDDKLTLLTLCFREDIEEDEDGENDYFRKLNSPVIISNTVVIPLTTPPSSIHVDDCNYSVSPPIRRKRNQIIEEEDFSIIPVNELSPIESIIYEEQIKEEEPTTKALINFNQYHTGLVQHYKDILLKSSQSHNIFALPPKYQHYIEQVRNTLSL